jgi:hypothetical protein
MHPPPTVAMEPPPLRERASHLSIGVALAAPFAYYFYFYFFKKIYINF